MDDAWFIHGTDDGLDRAASEGLNLDYQVRSADETGQSMLSHLTLSATDFSVAYQWWGDHSQMQWRLTNDPVPEHMPPAIAATFLAVARHANRLLAHPHDGHWPDRLVALNGLAKMLAHCHPTVSSNLAGSPLRHWLFDLALPMRPGDRLTHLTQMSDSLWNVATLHEWSAIFTDNLEHDPEGEPGIRTMIKNMTSLATVMHLLSVKQPERRTVEQRSYHNHPFQLHQIVFQLTSGLVAPGQSDIDWLTWQDREQTAPVAPDAFRTTPYLPKELASQLERTDMRRTARLSPSAHGAHLELDLTPLLQFATAAVKLRILCDERTLYFSALHDLRNAAFSCGYWTPRPYTINTSPSDNIRLSMPGLYAPLMRNVLATIWITLNGDLAPLSAIEEVIGHMLSELPHN